jgi:hypothetical protein
MAVHSIIDSEELNRIGRWDPEYYQPSNMAMAQKLQNSKPRPIWTFADVTDGIHASPEWVDVGVPYLSAKCVKEFFIDLRVAGQISHEQDAANQRTRGQVGDVLITSVGTIGNVAVVEERMLPANMDRHLGIIRIRDHKEVDPYYLATFLNSSFGRFQSVREATGNVQPNLFIQKIRQLLVPTQDCIQKIGDIVKAALDELREAENYYPDAEAEMLERLGWNKVASKPLELCYVADFDELEKTGRIDPEFFHPHYARLRTQIKRRGSVTLGSICDSITRGVQPEFDPDGDVLALDSKSIRPQGVEPAEGERVSQEFYDRRTTAMAHVHYDDVLLNSTGRGTLGRAACYRRNELAVCDNHIAILRPDQSKCLPVYLALFLNSPAGLAQSEQFQTGSSGQLELYPSHVAQFQVFVPRNTNGKIDLAWQQSLADRVLEASRAKERAREKLEEAKRLVEDAIGH